MYEVDERDIVTPLAGVPGCDPGAPVPWSSLLREPRSSRTTRRSMSSGVPRAREDIPEEEVVVVQFGGVRALMFGAPNDEALHGHPLAGRGLDAYSAYRVEQSSWVRRLER